MLYEIVCVCVCMFIYVYMYIFFIYLRALGISVTDYTFEDCQLALAEGQLHLPTNTCLLEFAKLVRNLG